MPEVRVAFNEEDLARTTAREILAFLRRTLRGKKRFGFVLAGGRTPDKLYQHIARASKNSKIPWSRVHFFWGDERFVPARHPNSNYFLAWKNLLGKINVPPVNVHPVPTDVKTPDAAASAYERLLKKFFPGRDFPRFDLVLLGLGEDGHVASLFPGTPALREKNRWVVGVKKSPRLPSRRISLTLPSINHAERIMFLVAGARKARILKKVLGSRSRQYPAQGVRPVAGSLVWRIDRKAARFLEFPRL